MPDKVTYHVWEDGFGIFDLGQNATHDLVQQFIKELKESDGDFVLGGFPFEVVPHPGNFRKGAVVKESILESFFEEKG